MTRHDKMKKGNVLDKTRQNGTRQDQRFVPLDRWKDKHSQTFTETGRLRGPGQLGIRPSDMGRDKLKKI